MFDFIAPEFLRHEISKHHNKLCKISGMSSAQVCDAEFYICRDITFISEEQIKPTSWLYAEKLVHDVDPKDTPYLAFSKHFRCKIWSGDKQLMDGLAKKNFKNFITTEALYKLREKKRL